VFSGVAWPDMGGRGCYNHPELLKRCGQHLSQGEGHAKPYIMAHYPLIGAYYISNVTLFMLVWVH
jgi:hypothetical protein